MREREEGGMVGGKERRRWKRREGGKEDKGGAGIIYFICTNVDLQDIWETCVLVYMNWY